MYIWFAILRKESQPTQSSLFVLIDDLEKKIQREIGFLSEQKNKIVEESHKLKLCIETKIKEIVFIEINLEYKNYKKQKKKKLIFVLILNNQLINLH